MIVHQTIHTDVAYEVYEGAFSWSSHFTTLKRADMAEKPYKCVKCEGTFSDIETLLKHEDTHVNDEPFACDHCEMTFSQKFELTIHELVHTDEILRHKNSNSIPSTFVDCGVTIKSEDIKEEINEWGRVEDPLSIDHESVNNNDFDMIDIEEFKLEPVRYIDE